MAAEAAANILIDVMVEAIPNIAMGKGFSKSEAEHLGHSELLNLQNSMHKSSATTVAKTELLPCATLDKCMKFGAFCITLACILCKYKVSGAGCKYKRSHKNRDVAGRMRETTSTYLLSPIVSLSSNDRTPPNSTSYQYWALTDNVGVTEW
eukprot:c34707_g1_i1 orf=1168-1620(+)